MLNKVLFDELDLALGEKDNIDPQLLINSDVSGNFSDILEGFSQDPKIQDSPFRSDDVTTTTSEAEMGEKPRNGRKRKQQNADLEAITGILKKKWKDDEEARQEQEFKEDQRAERQEKRDEDMISCLKMMAEAVQRLASA